MLERGNACLLLASRRDQHATHTSSPLCSCGWEWGLSLPSPLRLYVPLNVGRCAFARMALLRLCVAPPAGFSKHLVCGSLSLARRRPSGTFAVPVLPRRRVGCDDRLVSRARGAAFLAAIGSAVALLRLGHAQMAAGRVRTFESGRLKRCCTVSAQFPTFLGLVYARCPEPRSTYYGT